jgi:hypothetical protein
MPRKAKLRLIVLVPRVRHQVEPDPFQLAQRRGPDTLVLDWRERRVCFLVRRPGGGFRGERDRGARGVLITWACAPVPLCSRRVWPCPSFLRCQRDQACVLDPTPSANAEHRAQLKRGADRPSPSRPPPCEGRRAQLRRDALGPGPVLGQRHQGRLLHHQRQSWWDRGQAGLPRSVPAAALLNAGR